MKPRRVLLLALSLVVAFSLRPAFAQNATDTIAKILQAEDSAAYSPFLEKVMLDVKRPALERNLAARAIGHIGDPDGALHLVRALDDKTMDHAVAAQALGELWANTPARAYKVDIVPLFMLKLVAVADKDPSLEARAAAFRALALAFPSEGLKEAQDTLSELAAGRLVDQHNVLLPAIMRVAGEKRPEHPLEPGLAIADRNKRRQAILAYGLTHPSPEVSYLAAYYAGRPSTTELDLTEPLTLALQKPDALTRAAAARALARRKVNTPAVLDAVKKMLAGGATQEKIAAAEAVAALLPPPEAFDALKQALAAAGADRATSLHQALLEKMGESKAPGAAEQLWNLAKQKPAYVKLAQLAAAHAGLPAQIQALDAADAAASDDEALHYVALLEAAKLTDRLNWLAKGENVPERFVRVLPIRQRIVMALAYDDEGKPRGEAVENHPEWLTDPDAVIRAAAFASAGASGKRKWIKPLIQALKKTRTERDPEPAIAVLEAMDQLMESKEARAEAELVLAEMLRNTLGSKRLMVRRKTVELMHKLLHEIHKRELYGEQTGKSLADYQTIAERLVKGDGALPMTLKTAKGDIKFVVRRDLAPLTAENFARLAAAGFYDNLVFHRVVPAFVIQGGDPLGAGVGGPGYFVRDEEGAAPFAAGALGMASAGHDTAGSQFFFTAVPTPHLDGRYTAFGRIADDASLAVIEAVTLGDRILSIRADAPGGTAK